MNKKQIVWISIAAVIVIGFIILVAGGIGKNNDQNWQVIQSVGGAVVIRDKAGYYPKWFATVWTYPRYVEATYNDDASEGEKPKESIRATFNDGGTADVCTYVRISTPVLEDKRKEFHRQFSGNVQNATIAVRNHMINCIKAAAPLMSASENQSARKAEFAQVIENMLKTGLYKMNKIEKELKDRTDEKGNPITVYATEIIVDGDGNPIISQSSPLEEYGICVIQFSVTAIEYDEITREQFAAKKQSFLRAENSKAEREEMVQGRLMIIEKGLKDKAEVEATANKDKAKAIIEAEKKVELAEKAKQEAETQANMRLEVAKIAKMEAETKANQELEVAKVGAMAAEQEAKAIQILAIAQEEKIKKAGAITEKERVTLQIAADRDAQVASFLANVKTPQIVFNGGSEAGGSNWKDTLMNLYLLKQMKALPSDDVVPVMEAATN